MATAVHLPVSEYLQTIYHPDGDYVDGELQERKWGEQKHGLIQSAVAAIFYANRKVWALRAITELCVQVSVSRFRIPDVCVVHASEAVVPILMHPPLLCVEVLSPEDRLQRIVTRAQDYQQMGVPNIWIIDPETREAWTIDANGGALPMLDDAFMIAGTAVRLAIADIFEEIDAAPGA